MEYVAAGDIDPDGVHMLSTGGMLSYMEEHPDGEYIVATENGMLHPLQQAAPKAKLVEANRMAFCKYMKMITLPKVRDSLRDFKYEVKVPPEIAARHRADRAHGRDRLTGQIQGSFPVSDSIRVMGRIDSPSWLASLSCCLATGASAHAQSPEPRVVGGSPTTIDQYPWQAAVVFVGSGNAHQRQFCGGSLVTPSIVLTAAHCVYDTDPDCNSGGGLVCNPGDQGGDGTKRIDPNDVDGPRQDHPLR